MTMRVALGTDHGGYPLKSELLSWMNDHGYEVLDVGAHALNPADDYPDFSEAVAQAVASGKAQRGIIICGSGIGGCVLANKISGVRAGTCHDTYSAHQGVEHDDMNVLCLGARVIGVEVAKELVKVFLSAQFSGDERHRRRLQKLLAIEARNIKLRESGREED